MTFQAAKTFDAISVPQILKPKDTIADAFGDLFDVGQPKDLPQFATIKKEDDLGTLQSFDPLPSVQPVSKTTDLLA